jgi:hypothetical protein
MPDIAGRGVDELELHERKTQRTQGILEGLEDALRVIGIEPT